MATSTRKPSQKIKWETPSPAHSENRGKAAVFVEALKTRPSEWALYRENAKNAVLVTEFKRKYPFTEWTSRKNADGTFRIYGRYVGS